MFSITKSFSKLHRFIARMNKELIKVPKKYITYYDEIPQIKISSFAKDNICIVYHDIINYKSESKKRLRHFQLN